MNKYKNFILIILGLLLTLLYIWNRLFRIRLPRDIPLNLTFYYFFILLLIIFFHIFIIVKILTKNSNQLININFLYQPFKAFYSFLINRNLKIYDNFFNKLYFFGQNQKKKQKYFYQGINFIKLLISSILFIEVLIIGKIKIFYSFLILLIIPILYRIYLFILKEFFERKCEQIDNQIAIQWNNPPKCDPDVDFQLITSSFYIKEISSQSVSFSLYLKYMENLIKNYPEKNIDFSLLEKQKIDYINNSLRNLYLLFSNFSNESNSNLSKIIQIIISSLYIISWSYVLFISINSLDIPINSILNIISAREDNIFL